MTDAATGRRCNLRANIRIVGIHVTRGWSLGWVSAVNSEEQTIWIAHRDDRKRFIVRSDEKLTAFVELERQVLTVTFYLESIQADS